MIEKHLIEALSQGVEPITDEDLILSMCFEQDDVDEIPYEEAFSSKDGHLQPERIAEVAVDDISASPSERLHLAGGCERCNRRIARWRSKIAVLLDDSKIAVEPHQNVRMTFSVSAKRLAANTETPVTENGWKVIKCDTSKCTIPEETVVLNIERTSESVGDGVVMVRLDWRDGRDRLLGSTLAVLDKPFPVFRDGEECLQVSTRVAVPEEIAKVDRAVLSGIKEVSCVDDFGVTAVSCLRRSIAESLRLGLRAWQDWATALEAVLSKSPKTSDDIEAEILLLLTEMREQLGNSEHPDRWKASLMAESKKLFALYSCGIRRQDDFSFHTAKVAALSLLFQCIR